MGSIEFNYHGTNQTAGIRVRFAPEGEIGSADEVWYEGLRQEEDSPWENYLKKWTPSSAAGWFVDSKKRLGAKMLVAEKERRLLGSAG